MLSILLLGPPQVLLDQRPVRVTRRKSRALVYYLAAHRAPFSRDHLSSLLWPEGDRKAAQQTLRTVLHDLRQALGEALLVADDSVALASDTEVDARLFESRLQSPISNPQSLITTLALYRGDFLQGFSLPDSAAFDDWQATAQERYRRLAIRGLTLLSQLHEANRDFSAALDALTRALDLDPLQEDLQRAALRLHYFAGDRAGAIRRYEALRQLLDEEMGVPPMAETRALYDAIITDTLPDTNQSPSVITLRTPTFNLQRPTSNPSAPLRTSLQSPTSTALPFTGRAAELQMLREATTVRRLALVEGQAGIGKTRLAEEFIRAKNALALIGVAHELEQTIPYQPMIEALRGLLARPEWPTLRASLALAPVWLNETARLLPELAAPETPRAEAPHRATDYQAVPAAATDESRLWEGVHQFLLALAWQRAIVLFLDDLHWADASTLALLGYLVRRGRAADAPIFFLATVRPAAPRSPLEALLQALTREDRMTVLALTRLAPDDIAAIARHLSPAHAEPLADWLTRMAEGNPYILSELIRYARENDILRPDGSLNLDILSASPVVPQTVYSLIRSRLSRLSDAARRVLDAAVAVGREFEFEIVVRAAGLSENAALDALDELRAAGLIVPSDELRYTFDHCLTMEVAYREVGEARHRLLHRRVAEALEAVYRSRLDSVAGLLASHFAEGGVPDQAAHYAFRAGQRAAGLAAWTEARAFYEQALNAETDEAQRLAILIALGKARLQAGELAKSSEAFRAALTLAETRADVDGADAARLELVESLLPQARFAEAIALVQQVRAEGQHENAANAEFLWGVALNLEGADLAGAVGHFKKAESLLRQQATGAPADPVLLTRIKFEMGNVVAEQGDLPGAVTLYREALAAAGAAETEATMIWHVLAYNNLAYHLHLLDARNPAAVEHARAGLALAQEKGALGALPFLLSTLGEIALAQDDLETAEEHFSDGLAFAERLATAERIAGLTANLGLVAARRGEIALAVRRLTTALARAQSLGAHHLAAQIHVWLAPLFPPAEARLHFAEARAIAERGGRRRLLDEITRLEPQVPPA